MPTFVNNILNSEAAVTISFVMAILSLAISFGIDISDKQVDAIASALTNLLAFTAAGFAIRKRVYSENSYAEAEAAPAKAPE